MNPRFASICIKAQEQKWLKNWTMWQKKTRSFLFLCLCANFCKAGVHSYQLYCFQSTSSPILKSLVPWGHLVGGYLSLWYGRNLCNFWCGFWEKWWPHKFILNLTDLYKAPKMPSLIWIGSDEKDNYLFSVSSLFFSCSSGLSDFEVTCAWVLKSCVISPTSFLTRSTKKRFYVNITLGNLAIHIRTFFQIRIYLMV